MRLVWIMLPSLLYSCNFWVYFAFIIVCLFLFFCSLFSVEMIIRRKEERKKDIIRKNTQVSPQATFYNSIGSIASSMWAITYL